MSSERERQTDRDGDRETETEKAERERGGRAGKTRAVVDSKGEVRGWKEREPRGGVKRENREVA